MQNTIRSQNSFQFQDLLSGFMSLKEGLFLRTFQRNKKNYVNSKKILDFYALRLYNTIIVV